MLRLFVNETEVHLAENSQAELVLHNPFFVTRFTQQDYTYPFSISATPEMRKLFNHVENRESRLLKKEHDCVLVLGSLSRKGKLRITDFINNEYRVYLYISAFSLSSLNTPLNEFSRPLSGNLATQWTDGIDEVWPDTPMYFPTIYNSVFYDSAETEASEKTQPLYTGIVNGYSNGFLWNTVNNDGEAENKYAACPMPAILEVLKIGVEAAGYTLAGDVLADNDLAKAWLFNNRGLDLINTDDELYTTAERGTTYVYSLNSSPVLDFIDSSSSLFNEVTDEYTPVDYGIVRIKVQVTFSTPYGSVDSPRIRMKENGVFPPSGIQSPSIGGAGVLTLETNYIVNSTTTGTDLSFQIFDPGSTVDIDVDEITAEFEYIDGENKLIRFADPTNLQDYLPAIKFQDFLNGLFALRQLVAIPDEEKKVLYVNFKSQTRSLTKAKDFNNFPYNLKSNSISPIIDKRMVRFKEASSDEAEYLGTNLEEVWVYEDETWTKYEQEPDNFEGHKTEISLAPIYGLYSITDFPFLNGDLLTLRIDHAGRVSHKENQPAISGLYLALFEGKNGSDVCPAHYKTATLNLKLDTAISISLLKAFVDHVAWLENRSRKKEITFSQVTQLPKPDELIIWDSQLWVWEEMTITFSENQPPKVTLLLL